MGAAQYSKLAKSIMRLGPFDFRPSLWPTLATLLLVPILLFLGHWQLERAVWKQGLIDAHAERIRQPAESLQSLLSAPTRGPAIEYRQVAAQGAYDLDHQLLLDNQTYQGAAGYDVLTPMRLEGASSPPAWVLVNRGWVPLGERRSILPPVPGPTGDLKVRAMIRLTSEQGIRLGAADEPGKAWPRVVEQLNIRRIEQRLGHSLLPFVLLLDPKDPHGFVRDWKPVYGITPAKHRAYAAQWYTLALVLLAIYFGVNTRRVHSRPEDSGTEHS